MNHKFFQVGERVDLRPLSEDEAQKMRVLRNKNAHCFFDSTLISEDMQTTWYKAYLNKTREYMFSVYLSGTEQWIGAVGIYEVNLEEKTAEFGRLLIDKDAIEQRGLGVDTTLAACKFAFEQLGIEAVYLDVYSDNIPAVRTYLKAGFSFVKESCGHDGRVVQRMVVKNNGK